jgi:hypothetical protein
VAAHTAQDGASHKQRECTEQNAEIYKYSKRRNLCTAQRPEFSKYGAMPEFTKYNVAVISEAWYGLQKDTTCSGCAYPRLNMEVDLQSLFGLLCKAVLIG